MDVVHLLIDVLKTPEVPVVSTSSLPESVVAVAIGLDIGHGAQEVRGIGPDPDQGPFRYR